MNTTQPMSKAEELGVLDSAINQLGPDSYIDPMKRTLPTGVLLSNKVHILKRHGEHWAAKCGSERRVWGVLTGQPVTCLKCLASIQDIAKATE